MIDTSIIDNSELLERAKKIERAKRNEYQKSWRKRFIEKHGIEPNLYYEAKKLKELENE